MIEMEIGRALELINNWIIYRPGWTLTAEDHSNRFESTIKVRIEYPAQNTDQDQAPDYPTNIVTYATFPITVGDCTQDEELYRKILDVILVIEEHEAREYFRVKPTYEAPYHPHRLDGMERWGNMQRDLQFGIA